ncbi:laminin subunit beta-1-like [Lycorma delicatula]|uniref:laminin subunit beta-1-like n=1 Tax=Lycorma delicatula TaxID=130591 RepID=UPI003F50D7F2
MDYNLVIRFEPQLPGQWDNVKITVEREEPIDVNGACGNSRPKDDIKDAYLSSDSRNYVTVDSVCLESNKKYKIRLQFKHFGNQIATPTASILVDSIVLIPRVENLPFFQTTPQNINRLKEYEHYRCRDQFLNVVKGEIPDVCKKYDYSIGFYVFGGAFSCDCDLTGSVSTLCNSLGGKCQCKPNVEGRRCDHCSPGTYGFGPEGCKSCDCNSVGALDNFCDVNSGQCKCHNNTYGRECDQCQPGSWNFPNCQRCQCNGHADNCHLHTGACENCEAATTGHNCERCIEGYYGDPRLGKDIPCRPCPCPGSAESGHSYAERCLLDADTQDVVCECDVGYAGSRCDVCADNYFGNPDVPGGSCQACNCSNNIDVSHPGNCNPSTGECLNCLLNTEGFNCEVCKPNYYGNAAKQSCRECVCDILGTDAKAGPCDRITGQCPCLPNVIGQECDECKPNHWKIASGTGCEPCNCDKVGSTSEPCNQFDGRCTCKPGFGGRQCSQCQELHWGDPNVHCYKCECNPEGSATLQCHQQNGTCICMLGIGGPKCDICARGFLGNAPQCSPCGECFDNWDAVLTALGEETKRVINAAKEIKRTGATGAYTQEFETMEKKLEEVKLLLQNTAKSSVDLGVLENIVDTFRANLTELTDKLNHVNKLVDNTAQRIYFSNIALNTLRNKTNFLEETARNLKDNATRLQESNVEGALNLTREALKNSLAVQGIGTEIQNICVDAERQRKRTDNLVSKNSKSFLEGQQMNEDNLKVLDNEITKFEQEIPTLNQEVCDERGDPCDSLCGGAGCGHCGGLGCDDGAVTKAEKALSFAKDAEKHIREKEATAEERFRGISQAKQETMTAHDQIQKTYDLASQTKNNSENAVSRSTKLADELEYFLSSQKATPAEIRNLATDALSKNIRLQPEHITDIAKKINDTIASRTDINKILNDTSDNLTLAKQHKQEADKAKEEAEIILKRAQSVVEMLNEAEVAQVKALTAIDTASNDISTARKDLTQTASETREAQHKANETVADVKKLQDKLKMLHTSFLKNEKDASEVADGLKSVDVEVSKAKQKASELRTAYGQATDSLEQRGHNFSLAHARVQQTYEKASKLFIKTKAKLKELQEAKVTYNDQETTLLNLSQELDSLNGDIAKYLNSITTKSKFYRNCLN